jgi:sugar lactone lactonase YvrE
MRILLALLASALLHVAAHAQMLVITTVAGGGVGDFSLARDASIHSPAAVAFDASGSLYIADQGFHRVRRVARDTGIITTFAGNGQPGFAGDGAAATSAMLSSPAALAFDASGNLYIADSGNDRVRMVAAGTGIISTFAGGGDDAPGLVGVGDGRVATEAILRFPSALAVDAGRANLYVADKYHARIRRIDLVSRAIDTVAGSGRLGYAGDGAAATRAKLNNPAGVAVAANGDLYIADENNGRVRKVDARTGVITTVAGGPPYHVMSGTTVTEDIDFEVHGFPFPGEGGRAIDAALFRPRGVALDAIGNVYIADAMLSRVLKVDHASGRISNVAGNGVIDYSGDGGPAAQSGVAYPVGLAFDESGNLHLADQDNHVIRRISASTGVITRVAGSGDIYFSGDGGDARNARLSLPAALAFSPGGELHVSDLGNLRVRKITARGAIQTVAGGGARNSGFYCTGELLATDAEGFFAAGIVFDRAGVLYVAAEFDLMVCTVGLDGLLRRFAGNPFGEYSEYFGDNGDGQPALIAAFARPVAVAFDPGGDLFVADNGANRVRRIAARDGIITTHAGIGLGGFSGDGGPANRARLNGPSFLAFDGARFLYVADFYNNRVRRVDLANGVITTVAGNGTEGYSGDGGPATAASLSGPSGIAVDAAGNLYIADHGNHRIRKVVRDSGVIATIAGTGEPHFGGDGGDALAAGLHHPAAIVFDAAGNLYVSDQYNDRIRKISPAAAAPSSP